MANPYKPNGTPNDKNNSQTRTPTQFTTAGTGRPILPSNRMTGRPPTSTRNNRGGKGPNRNPSTNYPYANNDCLTTIPGFDTETQAARIPPSPSYHEDQRGNGDRSNISITGNNNRVEYNNTNNTNGHLETNKQPPEQTQLPPPPPTAPARPPGETPFNNGGITNSQVLELNKEGDPQIEPNSNHNDAGDDAQGGQTPTFNENEENKESDEEHNSSPLQNIYKTLLPSGGTLDTAYAVPEDSYNYKPQAKIAIPEQWKHRLNEFTTFETATEPLIPLENLSTTLKNLQGKLDELTHQFNKQKRSIQRATTNTNFTHKCVNVKATFHTPTTASKFPQLAKIYDNVNKDIKAAAETYSKLATRIIVEGQKAILFQHRLERILTFTDTLIYQVANFHAFHYRQLHKHKHTELNGYIPKTKEELATLAVYRLLLIFDHNLCSYFNINPKALLDVYHEYKPESKTIQIEDLNELDKQAVEHTLHTMCRYVKTITSIPHQQKLDKERATAAAAKTLAAIERQQAREATQATQEAIMQQGEHYPTTPKTLADAVRDITRKQALLEQKKAAKQKLHEAKRNALQAKRQAQNNHNGHEGEPGDTNTPTTRPNKRQKHNHTDTPNPKDTSDQRPPVAAQEGNKRSTTKKKQTRRKRGQQRR